MFYPFSLSASESVPTVSGIYIIFNQVSFAYYIGSTINVRKRMREHIRALDAQTHRNRYLQRAYRSHGPNAFVFSILEEVSDIASLISCEQRWLDTSSASYNLSPTAGSPLGVKYSEEVRRAISERKKGCTPWNKGKELENEDARRKMSEAKLGRDPWNKGKKGLQEAWNKGKPMGEASREKDRQEALKRLNAETPEQRELRRERLARGRETIRERIKAREASQLAEERKHIARLENIDLSVSFDSKEYRPLTLFDID